MARVITRSERPDWVGYAHWRGRGRAHAWRAFALATLAALSVASALIIGGLLFLENTLPRPKDSRIVREPNGWRAYGSRPSRISLVYAQREPALCVTD